MANDDFRLCLSGVRFGYPGEAMFLGPVDLALDAGTLLAVVGPNGAGKSTLLRLVAGLLAPREGTVTLGGRQIDRIRPRLRAALIAFVPQRPEAPPDLIARDVALLGRFPHRRFAFFETAEDFRIVEHALRTTEASELAPRSLRSMSTGEQQRVHLAAAIAQQPRVLVLDEPTSALDPYYQLSIFGVLRQLAREQGVAIMVATHDLNLAGQYADTVLLIAHGQVDGIGPGAGVLCPARLERVYGLPFRTLTSEQDGRCWVVPVAPAAAPIHA